MVLNNDPKDYIFIHNTIKQSLQLYVRYLEQYHKTLVHLYIFATACNTSINLSEASYIRMLFAILEEKSTKKI